MEQIQPMEQGFVPLSFGYFTLFHLGLPLPLQDGPSMDYYFHFMEEDTPIQDVSLTSSRLHKVIARAGTES